MKKFEYKVQPIGTFERNSNQFDTDMVTKLLNSQGWIGFELVSVSDGFAYFKREVSQDNVEYLLD